MIDQECFLPVDDVEHHEWDPVLGLPHDRPPIASTNVQVDHEEQDHLENLEACLDVVGRFKELDDLVKSKNPTQLEDAKDQDPLLLLFLLKFDDVLFVIVT